MQLNPYLNFNGKCEAAFKFYEQVLGGKIVALFRYSEMPGSEQSCAEMKDAIMHARLVVDDSVLMGSDAPPGRYDEPKGFEVSILAKSPEEADRIFNALAENGSVNMPIQETFWAVRFGMLVDQFGIPWMVNCERES